VRTPASAGFILALAMSVLLAACSGGGWRSGDDDGGDSKPPASQPPSTPAPDRSVGEGTPSTPVNPKREKDAAKGAARGESMVGMLRGGIMGIGGEHTSFILTRDGKPDAEIDLTAIKDADRFVGKRVSVSGRWVDKKYIERGTVSVFVVQTITEKDAARH
jgi:hypothetical protein